MFSVLSGFFVFAYVSCAIFLNRREKNNVLLLFVFENWEKWSAPGAFRISFREALNLGHDLPRGRRTVLRQGKRLESIASTRYVKYPISEIRLSGRR